MYIALGHGQTTLWPCHFAHLLQVPKISLKSDFIHIFACFIHVYSPGAGADNPLGP